MKFSTRLAITFTTLFFIVINVFGAFMITNVQKTEINIAEKDAIEATMSMASFLEESEGNLEDSLININGGKANDIGTEIVDENGKVVASSLKRKINIPDSMLFQGDIVNSIIQEYKSKSFEIVTSYQIKFQGTDYTLVRSKNITELYNAKNKFIALLLLFDLAGGIAITIAIILISKKLTGELSELTVRVNGIAKDPGSEPIENESSIRELRELSISVDEMQSEINSKINELKEKNEEQERFIGSLTHEIRTPLTSIVGFSSLLQMKAEDETIKEELKEIHSSGIRIQNLTESLISLLTIDKEKIEFNEIELRPLVDDVLSGFSLRMKEENISLSVTGEAKINTDEGLFSILISNMLDNAIKAVKDSEEKNIEISINYDHMLITDTGCGISKEDLEKIYEPFYMADKSRKHTYGGFGLGLSICAKIKDVLGLSIHYDSKVGEGTSVEIQFDSKK